jgi:hypothetical protein
MQHRNTLLKFRATQNIPRIFLHINNWINMENKTESVENK